MASTGRFFETLGLVFRVAFRNLAATVPLAACVGVPVAVVNAVATEAFERGGPGSGAPIRVVVGAFALILAVGGTALFVAVLVYPIVMAGLAWAGTRAASGAHVSLAEVAARVGDRGPRGGGAFLLAVLAAVAAPMALLPLAVLGSVAWPKIGVAFGILAAVSFVYPGFVYAVRFSLAPAVAMSEDVTVTRALGRSRELVRGRFWFVFGIVLLTGLTASLFGSVATAPFAAAAAAGPAGAVGAGLGQALATTISTALTGVAAGVLYAVRSRARVEIRRATDDDAHGIAAVHVASWRGAYRGIVPDAYLDALSVDERERMWREHLDAWPTWVAIAEGTIVGFANGGAGRDEDAPPSTGELYAIYVEPSRFGRGIGRQLHDRVVDELRERGFTEATLWVLEGNARGRAFYERMGWAPDGETKTDERPGATLHEVRYRRAL
jgi:ribosomal protein S18 acetylase RimI-like enzyme